MRFFKQLYIKESQHVNTVVFLRFFASFSVVWTHLCFSVPNFVYKNSFLGSTTNFTAYGVDIFFIISGFIIPWSLSFTGYNIKKFGTFMLKRIIRLDPPYLATIILVLLSNYFYSRNHGIQYTVNLKQLYLHLGYLNAFFGYKWLNPVFWTLAIEFQYYIIIGIVYNLLISKKPYFRHLAIFLFMLPLVIRTMGPELYTRYSHTILVQSHLFLLGILIFLIKKRLISWLVFIIISVFIIKTSLRLYANMYAIAFWITTVIFILFINFETGLTNFLGKISYSLYLTHELVGARAVHLFSGFASNMPTKFLALFFALLVCIFCASLFYYLIERVSMRLSKKIKYSLSP